MSRVDFFSVLEEVEEELQSEKLYRSNKDLFNILEDVFEYMFITKGWDCRSAEENYSIFRNKMNEMFRDLEGDINDTSPKKDQN